MRMEGIERQKLPQTSAWIAGLSTLALFILNLVLESGENPLLHGLGVGLLVLGGLLPFPSMYTMRWYGQAEGDTNYMHVSSVVDRGLFALVRHPQYLGYMLVNLGLVLLSQRWPVIALGGVAIAFFYVQAVAEERYLDGKFGESYREYRSRVPRFNLLLGLARYVVQAVTRPPQRPQDGPHQ
jgi:protein-S-isoprenylcysteine O-methyltransferase Ste14